MKTQLQIAFFLLIFCVVTSAQPAFQLKSGVGPQAYRVTERRQ